MLWTFLLATSALLFFIAHSKTILAKKGHKACCGFSINKTKNKTETYTDDCPWITFIHFIQKNSPVNIGGESVPRSRKNFRSCPLRCSNSSRHRRIFCSYSTESKVTKLGNSRNTSGKKDILAASERERERGERERGGVGMQWLVFDALLGFPRHDSHMLW